MDRKVVEVSSLSLSFSVYLPTCLPLYVRVYLLISLSLSSTYLSIYLSVYLSIYLARTSSFRPRTFRLWVLHIWRSWRAFMSPRSLWCCHLEGGGAVFYYIGFIAGYCRWPRLWTWCERSWSFRTLGLLALQVVGPGTFTAPSPTLALLQRIAALLQR